MTLVVNLVAGPGAGKSTTAAATFAELKLRGVNCELVTEYAKELVWGETVATLGNQVYIMAKQYHRLWRLRDKVDVIVTDSPLFLSVYYGVKESQTFKELTVELFNTFDNITWFLNRVKTYTPVGRLQTEDEARMIDIALWNLLVDHKIDFDEIQADRTAPSRITERVIAELERRCAK